MFEMQVTDKSRFYPTLTNIADTARGRHEQEEYRIFRDEGLGHPLSKAPRPSEFLNKNEETLEQIVQEKDDKLSVAVLRPATVGDSSLSSYPSSYKMSKEKRPIRISEDLFNDGISLFYEANAS